MRELILEIAYGLGSYGLGLYGGYLIGKYTTLAKRATNDQI